ncbi:BTB/POZ domain-containing adapter for CUL3-mediated RhoA degradation protein 3-like, partial [Penaeus monodon]|uniref:BTB/POZ domain-containing adapter for CUL3-mediated RhoA degradation protein 3-like n=1 Tax=Penaeus monodon TaxID=6687 RepID=UPI0018A73DA2
KCGGLYTPTIGTLTKHDNMLRAMISGRMEVLTDSEGWILIDRCGKHFGTILNYLRDESIPMPENQRELEELLAEARYYCMSDLVAECEDAMKQKEPEKDPVKDPVCCVPLITSQKEEQMLIQSTTKPVVKLLVNRHNNKYSTSDDNLLKNIEHFDRLALRFSRRVLFIKNVIGSNEICLWAFYGHGKKVAEVCCTSIVYATDRKHTKELFCPESRQLSFHDIGNIRKKFKLEGGGRIGNQGIVVIVEIVLTVCFCVLNGTVPKLEGLVRFWHFKNELYTFSDLNMSRITLTN